MDQIYIAVGIIIFLSLVVVVDIARKIKRARAKRVAIENTTGKHVFMAKEVEELEENSQILLQFYGDVSALGSIRPGMKLLCEGTELLVKEVYLDDDTPEVPDPELPANSMNAAVMVEARPGLYEPLQAQLKTQEVIMLPVIE